MMALLEEKVLHILSTILLPILLNSLDSRFRALAHLNGSIDDLLLPEGDPDAAESLSSVFRILNVQDDNGTLIGLTHEVERRFGKSLNPNTKAFKLAAGHRARIRVRFTPEVEGSVRHGIFVRNNLTGIEVATFRAEGVKGEFKLGKFRHNHPKPEEMVLDFDMKEKHLKDCDSKLITPVY